MKEKFNEAVKEALESEENEISMDKPFRDRDDWDSLAHLSLIAILDEEFGVEIEDEEFEKINTFEDLYKVVERKQGE